MPGILSHPSCSQLTLESKYSVTIESCNVPGEGWPLYLLLILVLSFQRQEIKLTLHETLFWATGLGYFPLQKPKGFNRIFPFSNTAPPPPWPSQLPNIRERQEVFPVVFLCDDMMGQVDQWGKTHVRTRLLCTFPIFAISRAIPDPGCYQNLVALPEHWVPSTEQIYPLSWKWWAVARICSWLLWWQCWYSTYAARQKVSITLSVNTGGTAVFILLWALSSPGGPQGMRVY